MFCEKCGTELPSNAEFCTQCGANVKEKIKTSEKISDAEILLKVKPTFKFGYIVLPSFIKCSIFLLIFAGIFAISNFTIGMLFILIGFILLLVAIGTITLINKKQYDSYTYDFYKTKVIYTDSFLNLSEKEVKYKYIREIAMRQTFIQRYFHIGDIILYTNAESGVANGICIKNIENVNAIYEKIKSIVDI